MDIVARQPLLPSPSVIAYLDASEYDLWARSPFARGPDLIAYRRGPAASVPSALPTPVTGTLAVSLGPLSLSATGQILASGLLAVTLGPVSLSASGTIATPPTTIPGWFIYAANWTAVQWISSQVRGAELMSDHEMGTRMVTNLVTCVSFVSNAAVGVAWLSTDESAVDWASVEMVAP